MGCPVSSYRMTQLGASAARVEDWPLIGTEGGRELCLSPAAWHGAAFALAAWG